MPVLKRDRKRERLTMKKISILIPCYNEEENVGPISQAVVETMTRELPEYDYELPPTVCIPIPCSTKHLL